MSSKQALLREFRGLNTTSNVLGSLLRQPSLLEDYLISKDDFVDAVSKTIYSAIANLQGSGMNSITQSDLERYLQENYPSHYDLYKRNSASEFLRSAANSADPENFEAYYKELKKWTLLRNLKNEGFDVDPYYDPEEVDDEKTTKKRDNFESSSISDILNYYQTKLNVISQQTGAKGELTSVKAGGSEMDAVFEKWKKGTIYGPSYSSNYLTSITYGLRKKRFTILSAGTGTGKSRVTISNICHSFASKYWDETEGRYVKNPHGIQNGVLYIGTEMDIAEEVEPIMIAYISNIPQDRMVEWWSLTEEEKERVIQAKEILHESNIYLIDLPNYNLEQLESVISDHVFKYNVGYVFFDYIHSTPPLIAEYQKNIQAKMEVQDHMVLSNLSMRLKEMCSKYNISIDTWTQVSATTDKLESRDQFAVRGSKAIIDKCDTAGYLAPITETDKKKLSKILDTGIKIDKPIPTHCLVIYKNRGGKRSKVAIWLNINYGTMRVHDCFVTDLNYMLLPEIEQVYTWIDEDAKAYKISKEKKLIEFNKEIKKASAPPSEDVINHKEIEYAQRNVEEDNELLLAKIEKQQQEKCEQEERERGLLTKQAEKEEETEDFINESLAGKTASEKEEVEIATPKIRKRRKTSEKEDNEPQG